MPRLQDPRELPIRQVYTALRDKWLAIEDGKHYGTRGRRDNVTLTAFLREKTGLNLNEQVVSQWSTGSGQRRVAPSALYALMGDLGYDVTIRADGSARLVRAGAS